MLRLINVVSVHGLVVGHKLIACSLESIMDYMKETESLRTNTSPSWGVWNNYLHLFVGLGKVGCSSTTLKLILSYCVIPCFWWASHHLSAFQTMHDWLNLCVSIRTLRLCVYVLLCFVNAFLYKRRNIIKS